MRVTAGRHELFDDLDFLLVVESLFGYAGEFGSAASVHVDTFTKLRALRPYFARHRAEIHFQDPRALLRRDHHHVAVVRVLEFDQVIDVRRRIHGQAIGKRHLKLQPQEEGPRARPGEHRHASRRRSDFRGEIPLDAPVRFVEVVELPWRPSTLWIASSRRSKRSEPSRPAA